MSTAFTQPLPIPSPFYSPFNKFPEWLVIAGNGSKIASQKLCLEIDWAEARSGLRNSQGGGN